MLRTTVASTSGDLNCDHPETYRGVSGPTLKLWCLSHPQVLPGGRVDARIRTSWGSPTQGSGAISSWVRCKKPELEWWTIEIMALRQDPPRNVCSADSQCLGPTSSLRFPTARTFLSVLLVPRDGSSVSVISCIPFPNVVVVRMERDPALFDPHS